MSRIKQFKQQFSAWHWQKNLPSEKAQWMSEKAKKRKRDDQKDTVFHFGSKEWTRERVEASTSRSKALPNNSQLIGELVHTRILNMA